MTLSIIGFALLLGLIITLEVKSRKREHESYIRTENLIKNYCNDYRGRSLDDVKNLRYDIVRDFATLYIKGVDGIVSKEIIEAKERGYFDRIFIHNGKQYKFERFGQIRYDLISIIAKCIDGEPNELAGFKIYENGYFIWFDFKEEAWFHKEESIDSNLIENRLVKKMEEQKLNNEQNSTLHKTDVMCWVACSERLPDSIGSYLCFWENCYIGMLFFNSNKEWCEMWQQEKHKPTHWMPLPKPPCT